MRRFYTPALTPDSRHLILNDADEVLHLTRVIRLKPGDQVELTNGKGVVAEACLTRVNRDAVEVDVISARVFLPREKKIILACAIPKKEKFEAIVDTCTQLGADVIIPMVTARTETAGKPADWPRKQARYLKAAVEAMKQSRRPWLPEIMPVTSFEGALKAVAAFKAVTLYIPWLEGERLLLKDIFARNRSIGSVAFFIGPEGDFTPEEAGLAVDAGAVPVSLGPNVLKVDTAAAYVVGLSA